MTEKSCVCAVCGAWLAPDERCPACRIRELEAQVVRLCEAFKLQYHEQRISLDWTGHGYFASIHATGARIGPYSEPLEAMLAAMEKESQP